jgi:predicted acetyltransferase
MTIRKYDPSKDFPDAERLWNDVGWVTENKSAHLKTRLECDRAYIAEQDGANQDKRAECLVTCAESVIQYQEENINSAILTGVTTSLVARKSGIASQLTAHAISEEVAKGADLFILSMFEQGFYDRLGFGTGPYENYVKFHPYQLNVPDLTRAPQRLSMDQFKIMHQNHLDRQRGHGKISFKNPLNMKAQLQEYSNIIGLGFCDGPDEQLTHHLWLVTDNMEEGPCRVLWIAYQTNEQFLELLSIIKSLGDQMKLVDVVEPADIQFQDLLNKPFLQASISSRGRLAQRTIAIANQQYRICNLENVLKKTHLDCESFQFNLTLNDPISRFIDEDSQWQGISGNYIISLGEVSNTEPGCDNELPTLEVSVGAFTRMWFGAASATSLNVTDDLKGPEELLHKLNKAFRLPKPVPDLDF